MRIALNEIWNFLELIDHTEKGWNYSLRVGKVSIKKISSKLMLALKEDEAYDTELLPSIFTYREILWQPDIFQEASMSLPPLRILKAFCDEKCDELAVESNQLNKLYASLISGMARCCESAIKGLEKDRPNATKVLGHFRTCTFPIVKFFIHHPKNRQDYFNDAQNRLNYAVKIMLTQFFGKYTELSDPYWEVTFDPQPKKS